MAEEQVLVDELEHEQDMSESDDNNEDYEDNNNNNDNTITPSCDTDYDADNSNMGDDNDAGNDDEVNYENNDDDDDDDNDLAHEPYRLFFQQLIDAQKKDIKKRKQERFLPLIKSYLKASFAKREKMFNDNPQIIRHLVFLCRNIVNEKIPSSISGADKALMTLIADKHTPKEDVRLHLLEDYRILYYCGEALRACETSRSLENGGRCEKTDINGHGEVQQNDDANRTTCEQTQNNRRRKKNTNRSGTNR
jgi:hypothetical protein